MTQRSDGSTIIVIVLFTLVGWAMGATLIHPAHLPVYAGESVDGTSIAVRTEDGVHWIKIPAR